MYKEDNRVPAIGNNNKFTICSASGSMKVDLIEVIGRGGSCIAYKAAKRTAEGTRAVVVKEYYPQEDSVLHGIRYRRNNIGDDISLEPVGELREKDVQTWIDEEKARQNANVNREINMTSQLAYNPEHVENNPFCFNAENLGTKGDSTYIVIDTNEGCTLRHLLKKSGGKLGGEQSISEAIRYTRELLSVARQMLFEPENSFCHADIKPENIYLQGRDLCKTDDLKGRALRIMLLDFGSVFHPRDYQLTANSEKEPDDDEVIKKADEILYNEGIGCSSEGYRSHLIQDVYIRKSEYKITRSPKDARKLVNSINKIDNSVDIYSIVQCFFEMAIGSLYPIDKRPRKNSFERDYGVDAAVAEQMIKIGENNKSGYKTTTEVINDLDVLSAILNKNALPQVLLDKINSDYNKTFEIEEDLFGNIEFE